MKGGSVIETLKEILSDPTFQEGNAWRRQLFHDKDIIVKAGDIGDSLFFIEEGDLRVMGYVELENNRHVKPGYSDLHQGDIFGETCLKGKYKRTATVTAISDGHLLKIDGEKLNLYFDEHPNQGYIFYKTLFSILIDRMKNANLRVENLLAWGLKVHGIEKHL